MVPNARKQALHDWIRENVDPDAMLYTDEWMGYRDAVRHHRTLNHSARQHVDEMASTNGIESFRATLKRAYHGTYHWVSRKHLCRYVGQFVGKHNLRDTHTLGQMAAVVTGMTGTRWRYIDLIEGRPIP